MKHLLRLTILVLMVACQSKTPPGLGQYTFDTLQQQEVTQLNTPFGEWRAPDSTAFLHPTVNKTDIKGLHIVGGRDKSLTYLAVGVPAQTRFGVLHFRSLSRKQPRITLQIKEAGTWKSLDQEVDHWQGRQASLVVPFRPESELKMTVDSDAGVVIDKVELLTDGAMEVALGDSYNPVYPVLIGKANNPIVRVNLVATGVQQPRKVSAFTLATAGSSNPGNITNVKVYYTDKNENFTTSHQFGTSVASAAELTVEGEMALSHGDNYFWVSYQLNDNAPLTNRVGAQILSVTFADGEVMKLNSEPNSRRIGHALRQHWDDSVHTYRIPGLATTNKGTLIGVYDLRYNSAVDLQEDVDVGMNRSTDGGQTWEPMKIIMDMGEWGGKSDKENGIGDPSILVDRATNTIWVAAIWAHGHPGQRNWWASKPGLDPEQTSQFVLVKSEDDGVTWSDPINITRQIKDPKWHLLLQGPGKGITMADGTLVFPAQYKDENQVPHSTLIYSKDHGKTWKIGKGIREQTTEAQLVELANGSIMINARNNYARNKKGVGRVVAVTDDLGKSWQTHPSSEILLEESTCMASLIAEEFGSVGRLFLFSNPNVHDGRYNMTIKASFDEGQTWPEDKQLLLDEGRGRGYSCMTKIDDEHVGILYEGSQADLIFEKVKISEILR